MASEAAGTVSTAWAEAPVGDPSTGVVHGGAVSALFETACGAAVMAHPLKLTATATIDLRIDDMRAARPRHGLLARAE